ncbi:MAG: hypothetical protein KA745_11975 [Gemmatimonadales bacterium]|nr:hypothetical protein [Gemmatimonadales bacterium]
MSVRLSHEELSNLLRLARELCEQMDADRADDEALLEVRLLRAVEPLEPRLARACGADVAPGRTLELRSEP